MQSAIRFADKIEIFQTLARQTSNGAVNLDDRVQLANILPSTEFIHAFPQVFRTHLAIDTVVAALQAIPK